MDQALSVRDVYGASPIKIYPNPTDELLHLDLPENRPFSLMINDSSGMTIMKKTLQQSGTVGISGLSPGGYIVILSDGKTVFSKKIIKK